ncbi:hypothetical protein [Prosthecobacter sp.]|uniref:hypothetical protein n=1 Tax=Prosthecobacter sp. TaxID=1965333 RepID=UPI003784F0A3
MTLQQLQQQIGSLQREAARYALSIELIDRIAESCGHPQQETAAHGATVRRRELQQIYIRLHALEARLPTPEALSEAAFNRALMLGLSIDAAEGARVSTWRSAKAQRLAA